MVSGWAGVGVGVYARVSDENYEIYNHENINKYMIFHLGFHQNTMGS